MAFSCKFMKTDTRHRRIFRLHEPAIFDHDGLIFILHHEER